VEKSCQWITFKIVLVRPGFTIARNCLYAWTLPGDAVKNNLVSAGDNLMDAEYKAEKN
jgi:hypothetical protein